MVRTAMLRILTTGLTAALGAVTAAEYFIGNEAPILVITEGRSGSTLVGELFNQSPRVMYFYEPCRSLDPHVRSRSLAISESLERQKSCPDLVQAVLRCSFSEQDLQIIMADHAAVVRSRALQSLPEIQKDNSKLIHQEALRICKSSIPVIKEIRLSELPQALLDDGNIKILNLVRDPRAVLYSRLGLEAFCGTPGQSGACIKPLCERYRAVTRSSQKFSHLQPEHFMCLKYEDVVLQPLFWTRELFKWAALEYPLPPGIVDWIKDNMYAAEPDGPYSTKRNAKEMASKWRGQDGSIGLTMQQVDEVNQECGDILTMLNYTS